MPVTSLIMTLGILLISCFARRLGGFTGSVFGAIPSHGGFLEVTASALLSLSMEFVPDLPILVFELDWGEQVRLVTGFYVFLLECLYFLLMKSIMAFEQVLNKYLPFLSYCNRTLQR